ncbi:MAG: hypothetical protein LUG16_00625 [Candidatus Gastranaerophilales bacterium]|nr:hypothetical protein [Candidatus Gastranaerophilales bacterium]
MAITAIIPKITSAAKKFSGKPLAVTSKVLGVAAAASVIYDAHVNGKEKAYACDSKDSADRYFNQYSQYMDCEKESGTLAKLKKLWFDSQQNFSYYHIGSKSKGYLSGVGHTLVNNLPLIGLSAAALKFKNVGKLAGVALIVHGTKTLLYDVMGIGKKKSG